MKKIFLALIFLVYANANELVSDKSLIEGQFNNGFKYTIKSNQKPENTASLRLVVKVGSLEEDDDQQGVAHMVEHMAFNGSRNFKGNDMIAFLESLGINFGSHLNASTGFDRTIYQLEVPLKDNNLEKAMLVFSDWANGVTMSKDELDKERGVVLEEERLSASNVDFRIYKQIHGLLYKNSRFENRLPIGLKEVIKNVPLKRVDDFYKRWYQPKFMHFVAVGDFNVTKMETLIKNNFESLKNSKIAHLKSRKVEHFKGKNILFLHDKEVVNMEANLIYPHEYKNLKTSKDYQEYFEFLILEKLFALKAQEIELLKDPAAKNLNIQKFKSAQNQFLTIFNTSFVGENAKEAFFQMLNIIEDIKINGFSEKDFEVIKKEILSQNEHELNDLENKTSRFYSVAISEAKGDDEIYLGIENESNLQKELLEKITLKNINDRFKFLIKDDFLAYFVLPDGYKIEKDEIEKIIQSVKAEIKEHKKDSLPNKIEFKELKDANITQNFHDKIGDIFHFTFENGVKVAFKQNSYEKDKVSILGLSKGGYSLYDDEKFLNARVSADLVSSSGIDKFNRFELSKMYSDKIVDVSAFIDRYFEGLRGESSKKDFGDLMELVYLSFTKFRLDENFLYNEKIKMLELIEQEKNSPKLSFLNDFEKFYYKNNPRYTKLDQAGIEKLNEDEILNVFKDRFADFSDFTFFIVGDIEKDEVLKFSQKYLGNLPSIKRVENYQNKGQAHISGTHSFVKNLNNENISSILQIYSKPFAYTKENRVLFAALSDILGMRLLEVLREENSGVYGVMARAEVQKMPNEEAVLKIAFSCDPKQKDALLKLTKQTIEEIKTSQIDQKYINAFIKKSEVSLEEFANKNTNLLNKFANNFKFDAPFTLLEDDKKALKIVTPKAILKLSEEFFATEDVVLTELNPKK